MLPDYIIYDELKREKARRERLQDERRPQLEIPRYMPLWPDSEPHDEPHDDHHDDDTIRISMI